MKKRFVYFILATITGCCIVFVACKRENQGYKISFKIQNGYKFNNIVDKVHAWAYGEKENYGSIASQKYNADFSIELPKEFPEIYFSDVTVMMSEGIQISNQNAKISTVDFIAYKGESYFDEIMYVFDIMKTDTATSSAEIKLYTGRYYYCNQNTNITGEFEDDELAYYWGVEGSTHVKTDMKLKKGYNKVYETLSITLKINLTDSELPASVSSVSSELSTTEPDISKKYSKWYFTEDYEFIAEKILEAPVQHIPTKAMIQKIQTYIKTNNLFYNH